MDGKDLRIVFFGTAEIAADELEYLAKEGYNIVGVVTNIDKPQGRGKVLTPSPVKERALSLGLNILTPPNLKSENFLEDLRSFDADLQIVVAFRMMPKVVYAMPKYGTFNLHTSLLPQYRGAAPINWAIINGEKQTGITTFLLNDKIDEGEIILQQKISINEQMTFGDLYNMMTNKGKKLITDTIDLIASGDMHTIPQQKQENLKPAPKIFKEDTYIAWEKTTKEVINFIHGLCPTPAAKAKFYEKKTKKCYDFKFFNAKMHDLSQKKPLGSMWTEDKKILLVQCLDGTLEITDLQLNGKKRMDSKSFLSGFRITSLLERN